MMSNGTKYKILVIGQGRIGKAVCTLLQQQSYSVENFDLLEDAIATGHKYTDVFAAVPYFAIVEIAKYTAEMKANFYDFTENIQVKERIREAYLRVFTEKTMPAVVVGCGVAPGLCNMIAAKLMRQIYHVASVDICCGGVPVRKDINPLHYYNIWSLDGLWGLYFGEDVRYKTTGELHLGKLGDGWKRIEVMGKEYEAFYTGGNTVDALFRTSITKVSYSTVRHVGHLDKILILHELLNFKKNPDLFKSIIAAQEKDDEDETIISVEVCGYDEQGNKITLKDNRVITPILELSSMQFATAKGGVIAMQNVHKRNLNGFILQEDLGLIC